MKILIVDDHPTNRKLLRVTLEAEGQKTREAEDGKVALTLLESESFDAVISDVLMPNLDGYGLCLKIRQNKKLQHLPVIIYTATYTSPSDEELAHDAGADGYIKKPAPTRVILDALYGLTTQKKSRRAVHKPRKKEMEVMKEYSQGLVQKIEEKNIELERSNIQLILAYDATIEGWSRAMDLRDKETEGHTQRVTDMTVRLARAVALNENEIAHARRGALLHDMGKLGIPDAILLKPGKLTEEEWEFMRRHPRYAYEMLSPIEYLRPALDIPYCHHEKWDGTGYPRGLKGDQIPLAARIFAVVDVYDALTSDRPYRAAWSKEKTLEHIQSLRGTHFEPRVVDAFIKMMET
ncbi:MAG: response regulator [Chloroflexi bacterium]|nr:response regulator [Chloroflexota bacterium]